MQKAQFTIGVDVSRNTLDIYCIEVGRHITIDNNSIGFKSFQSFCHSYGIDISQAIIVLEYTGGYQYKCCSIARLRALPMYDYPGWLLNDHWG